MYRTREDLVAFIERRLDDVGENMKTASEKAGRNHAYLQQFMGPRATPAKLDEDAREAFARILRCFPDDLKVGEVDTPLPGPLADTKKTHTSINTSAISPTDDGPNVRQGATGPAPNILGLPIDIPAYGSASAGPDGRFEMNDGEPINYVRRPPFLRMARGAFAVYCEGTSMVPLWEPGHQIYVYPGHPVKVGDYVLITLKSTEAEPRNGAYVKRLVKKLADRWVFEQLNPHKQMSFPASRVESVQYVVHPNDLLKS